MFVLRLEKAICLSRAAVKHQNLAEAGDRLSLESAHLIGL